MREAHKEEIAQPTKDVEMVEETKQPPFKLNMGFSKDKMA